MYIYKSSECIGRHADEIDCDNCWVEILNHSFDMIKLRLGTYREALV